MNATTVPLALCLGALAVLALWPAGEPADPAPEPAAAPAPPMAPDSRTPPAGIARSEFPAPSPAPTGPVSPHHGPEGVRVPRPSAAAHGGGPVPIHESMLDRPPGILLVQVIDAASGSDLEGFTWQCRAPFGHLTGASEGAEAALPWRAGIRCDLVIEAPGHRPRLLRGITVQEGGRPEVKVVALQRIPEDS